MPALPSIFIAGVAGFVVGFVVSIPVGPINLTIMNEGARRGFKYAALIGLGASIMEVIYCTIAFTGFSSFFREGFVKTAMDVFTFLFMLFLGTKMLLAKSVSGPAMKEGRIETKFHPSSAFMTGFVRTMGNLGVLAWWIVIGVYFISHDWMEPNLMGKGACIFGVALGTFAWFTGLSYAVSLGHGKFSEKTLLRIERGSGIALLLLGLVHGVLILVEMHKKK